MFQTVLDEILAALATAIIGALVLVQQCRARCAPDHSDLKET